ncbi:MAG: L,D-transpeptidase family protein [Pseudomonadota bacterium]
MRAWLVALLLGGFGMNALAGDALSPHGLKASNAVRAVEAKWERAGQPYVVVSIAAQRLYLLQDGRLLKTYPVSTSAFGPGSQEGSNQTPLGLHRIRTMIGEGEPLGMVFKSRRPTGRIADIIKDPIDVPEDDVTTRIMWLEGLEPGINQGGRVDSYRRYIYIHGTPEEGLIGRPASHGCVRMYNADVVDLFARLGEGTLVYITH